MRLIFIRHGQSENNEIWDRTQSNLNRVADPQLTEIGKKQIEATSKFLYFLFNDENQYISNLSNKYNISGISLYCSLMDRGIQSGLILSKNLSLPLYGLLDVHENGGLYLENPDTNERIGKAGRSAENLKKTYPDLIIPSGINPLGWWNRPYEERETRRARARRVLNELTTKHANTNDTVLLVSHGGFYNYLLRALLEIKDDTPSWFVFYNGAITLLEFSEEHLRLVFCNRYDFLPTDLVT